MWLFMAHDALTTFSFLSFCLQVAFVVQTHEHIITQVCWGIDVLCTLCYLSIKPFWSSKIMELQQRDGWRGTEGSKWGRKKELNIFISFRKLSKQTENTGWEKYGFYQVIKSNKLLKMSFQSIKYAGLKLFFLSPQDASSCYQSKSNNTPTSNAEVRDVLLYDFP